MTLCGLTATGKSRFLADIARLSPEPVNLICGDVLQLFHNFEILSNRISLNNIYPNPKTSLYGKLNILEDEVSAFHFGEMVKNSLVPGELNIIEGGSGFYHHFLRTKVLNKIEIKTLVFYEENLTLNSKIVKRSIKMFSNGALQEVIDLEEKKKKLGVDNIRLKPIGYEVLATLIDKLKNLKDQESHNSLKVKKLVNETLLEFCRQNRSYSKTQFKYMHKYLKGEGYYWFDSNKESNVLNSGEWKSVIDSLSFKNPKVVNKDVPNSKDLAIKRERELKNEFKNGLEQFHKQ